jgi:hypothetical protein
MCIKGAIKFYVRVRPHSIGIKSVASSVLEWLNTGMACHGRSKRPALLRSLSAAKESSYALERHGEKTTWPDETAGGQVSH